MSDTSWRELALQFDAQRMQALAHIRALLADPVKHADAASAFLAAPPIPGEKVLAERLAENAETFWGFFHTTSIYESAPALISLHRTKVGAWKAMHKAQWDAWIDYQNHQVRRLEIDGARYRDRGWKVYAHELSLVKPVTLKD